MTTSNRQNSGTRNQVLFWHLIRILALVMVMILGVITLLLLSEKGYVFALGSAILIVLFMVLIFTSDKKITRQSQAPIVLPEHLKLPIEIHAKKKRFIGYIAGSATFGLIAYTFIEGNNWPVGLASLLFTFLFLYLVYEELVHWGKPDIRLDETGISTRTAGLIPWPDIRNVIVSNHESRGQKHSILKIEVLDPGKFVPRLPMIQRLFRIFSTKYERTLIGLSMIAFQQSPEYVEAVITRLRSEHAARSGVDLKTGDMVVDKNIAQIEKLFSSLNDNTPESEHLRVAAQIKKLIEANTDETKMKHDENQRQHRIFLFIFGIILTGTVVWIAYDYWR